MKWKWWDRHSNALDVKPPSANTLIKPSLWFYQTTSFWHVLFHARVNYKSRSGPLAVRILKLKDSTTKTICAQLRYTKKYFVSKLTTVNRLHVNWETTFLPLWREELNKTLFFVNVNACSNISFTIPVSFDTTSTKISQFCDFDRNLAWLNVHCCVFSFLKYNFQKCGLIFLQFPLK